MTKPRAFLFDVDDWLGSYTVERMSGDEVKAYLYLLCRSWHETPIATLPNDNVELARMARLTPERWDGIKGAVLAQFTTNGNGRIYNERLKKEVHYCLGRAKAGAAGWTSERRAKQAKAAKLLTKQRTKRAT